MSGVEAAGLVLAAFPLLISALEDYRQGFEVLEDWWQIQREYKKCKQNLKLQKLVFEENLEELLRPIVRDEDELSLLLADPGGGKWKDRGLEQDLKERLPKSYEIYLEIIDEVNRVMENLKDELGSSKVHFQNRLACGETNTVNKGKTSARSKLMIKPKLEYHLQRMRFSLNKTSRNKLLDELAQYNTKLRQLLDSSDRLAKLRRYPKQKKLGVGSTLLRFWHYAKSLHTLLHQALRCDCKSLHYASLFLQHHISSDVEFKIQFKFSQSAERLRPAPWTSQETRISLAEGPQPTTAQAIPASPGTLSYPNNVKNPSSIMNSRTRRKKGVTWIVPDPQSVHRNIPDISTNEINDLCTAITSTSPNCSCIGFLQDEEHRYNVYRVAGQLGKDIVSENVSLASLLNKTSNIVLTRRQRYSIALILASSHLQLHATPWLQTRWSKEDIFFQRSGNDSVLLDQPHIIHVLCGPPASTLPSSQGFGDRSVPTLGIMLLELCFGIALEDHHIRQNYLSRDGQPNAALDLAAAMEWCGRFANEEAGPEFADAIEWCLRNPTNARASVDVKDAGWREELYARVVEPLHYCHEQLTASTIGS